jgi:hypothetical protein
VYRLGHGPAVVLMHNVPGITPTFATFARRLAWAGFTVVVPSLFGTPGRADRPILNAATLARLLTSRQFRCLQLRTLGPVTDWLRSLASDAHREHGGAGVGAVGTGISGGFGLAMLTEPVVTTAVISEPALPLPFGRRRRSALGLSDADWRTVQRRVAAGCSVIGLRYFDDVVAVPERFATLRERLGDGFVAAEFDSSRPRDATPLLTGSELAGYERITTGESTSIAQDHVIDTLRRQLLGGANDDPVDQDEIEDQVHRLISETATGPVRHDHVFISYSHHDRQFVDRLVTDMTSRSIDVWFDRDLRTGTDWEDTLRDRLDTSKGVIVVSTPSSAASDYVRKEIAWARQRAKKIVPLHLDGPIIPALASLQHYFTIESELPGEDFYDDLYALMAG